MFVTVATMVSGYLVVTVVVKVLVLAVFVELTRGTENALEQYVEAGAYPVRAEATASGRPPLQNGLRADTMEMKVASEPTRKSFAWTMMVRLGEWKCKRIYGNGLASDSRFYITCVNSMIV